MHDDYFAFRLVYSVFNRSRAVFAAADEFYFRAEFFRNRRKRRFVFFRAYDDYFVDRGVRIKRVKGFFEYGHAVYFFKKFIESEIRAFAFARAHEYRRSHRIIS